MQKRLKGAIETNHNLLTTIKADDGDWYSFKTDLVFNIGDRVTFDPIDSPEANQLAMLGGPIPCENVQLIE